MIGDLERIGAQIEQLRHTQRHEGLRPDSEAVGALLLEDDLPLVVAQCDQRTVVVPVEELLARAWRLAADGGREVVAIEVDLEGLLADLHALEQLLLHAGHTRDRHDRRQHVLVGEDVVVDRAGLDVAGPADRAGHAVAAFPVLVLLAAKRRRAAIGPGEAFGAVVGRIHHDGVIRKPQFIELVKNLTDVPIVLDHAVGVDAQAGLALRFILQVREDMHAGGVPPQEERLVGFLRFLQIFQREGGDFLVDGLHALDVERAGAFDLLRAVRVGKAMDDATGRILLDQCRIFEVVGVLRLLLGVEVIQRAEELVETVGGGQRFVGIAEVVLAELGGHVALVLEQLGDGDIARLQAFLGAGQADLQHAGTEARLAGDEAGAAGGATLLAVPVGEHRALLGDAIDVRGLVAHHAVVIGADVEPADVVAPEDQEIRFLLSHGSILSSANKARMRQSDNPIELYGRENHDRWPAAGLAWAWINACGATGSTPLNGVFGSRSPWQKRNLLPLPQGQGW